MCRACGKDFPDRKFVDRNGDFFHAEVRDTRRMHAAQALKTSDERRESGRACVSSSQCAAKAAGNVCRVCRKPVVSGKVVEHGGGKLHADVRALSQPLPYATQALTPSLMPDSVFPCPLSPPSCPAFSPPPAQCFRCGECSKGLVGVPFGEKDGVAYCQTCMVSKARAPVKGTTTGAYTPGITVNPVTGATEQRNTAPTAGGAMIGARTPGLGTKDRCPKCDQAVYMGPDKVRMSSIPSRHPNP